MAEPTTTAATAILTSNRVWAIIASVCGSIIPIMALSDSHKIGIRKGAFMAITGSTFAIFVGPWVSQYLNIKTNEAFAALSWTMGAFGVFIIRTIFKWLERRGVDFLDRVASKATGVDHTYVDDNVTERIIIEKRNPENHDL